RCAARCASCWNADRACSETPRLAVAFCVAPRECAGESDLCGASGCLGKNSAMKSSRSARLLIKTGLSKILGEIFKGLTHLTQRSRLEAGFTQVPRCVRLIAIPGKVQGNQYGSDSQTGAGNRSGFSAFYRNGARAGSGRNFPAVRPESALGCGNRAAGDRKSTRL